MDEKEILQVEDGTFVEDVPDTLEVVEFDNPDDREYEEVEIEVEGGK